MSSLRRMLAILDEFSLEQPVLTAEELMERLSYSRGTVYRYLKELTLSGLLASVGGGYALGPKVIELDYTIRQTDPYITVVRPIMRALGDRLDCDVLMCSFYQGRVVVLHHERGADNLTMSYGRGRRMPTFLGAPSKSIIASLPKAKLKRLFESGAIEIGQSKFPSEWDAFYAEIKSIRRKGYALSKGELDAGNVGVAAPLKTDPPASLAFVFPGSRFEIADESRVADIIRNAAGQANSLIARMEHGQDGIDWFDPASKTA